MPAKYDDIDKKIEVHYLGYYLNWITKTYYYAVENCGFIPRLIQDSRHLFQI